MKATDILMEEHRVIERVLDALDKAVLRAASGGEVPAEFFLKAADFIRHFADGCHHRKEEGVLFTALEENGMPREGGPVGVMLAEHEEGRRRTRAMREAAERMRGGDRAAVSEAAANASEYVNLLRQHIQKEDRILFPMADRVIPAGRHAKIVESFDHVEHEETGEGVHEKYLALAEELERAAAAMGY